MNLRSLARGVLVTGLVLVAVVVGLAWFVGGQLCAPVPGVIGPPPPELHAQGVTFPSASGSLIQGWFSPGSTGQGVVLLLHGVRADRRDMLSRAQFLHGLRFSVLLIDFQAHGESPGRQITFGDRESRDVVAALNFLHRTLPAEKVGAIGVSLGAAAFVLAEDRPHVDAVVLESMYPTVEQAVADRLRLHVGALGPMLAPLLKLQLGPRLGVTADRLRPIDRMAAIGAPVFILNGTRDAHTSIEEAQALFAATSDPKEFWAVPGAAHVNLHTYAKAEYERRVGEFLDKYLQREHSPATNR